MKKRENNKKLDMRVWVASDLSKTQHKIFYASRKVACSVGVSCASIKGPGKLTNLFQKSAPSGYEELPRDLQQYMYVITCVKPVRESSVR